MISQEDVAAKNDHHHEQEERTIKSFKTSSSSQRHHHVIQPKDILIFLLIVLFISFSQYGLGHYIVRRNEFTLMEYTAACFVSVSALIGGFQFYFKAQQLALSTFNKSEYFNVDCFIDRYIPFVPHSIYLYSFGDLFIMACIIPTSPTMNHLIHILFGLIIVTLCQCLIFVTLPSNVPAHYRTELQKYEAKFGKLDKTTKYLFEMMHQMDHDTNTVPSGHCSIATYLALTQWHIFGYFTLLNPLLIACSCVMTKQHAFLDTVLGILFGFVIFFIVNVQMFGATM
ncbi:hypothetical protein C9374_013513 [Naegleria lovaniensis]|uniref:Inositolphosphotransferase Aur1/Ipt1 domain-containing protein n=1 Tax=Naegleria lovaniensis TaxID=51637 RepID=A0AA88GVY4_NAELO|nr:uncharacterized protein C9374_013513 [Naegleria lovaniensis]KAG2392028.1 hypothetical protein C9374_013513 [Naegleria lovaniensis]